MRAPVRNRPEPQLRGGLGWARRELEPEHADLSRLRPLVRARDPGRARVLAASPGNGAADVAQLRVAGASPAESSTEGAGSGRGPAQAARRPDGRRHGLHVAVRLAAL